LKEAAERRKALGQEDPRLRKKKKNDYAQKGFGDIKKGAKEEKKDSRKD